MESSKEDSSSDSCKFQRDLSIGEIVENGISNQDCLLVCVLQNRGLLYADEHIEIECNVQVRERKAFVSLDFLNKSADSFYFNGEVTSSPEGLKNLSSHCSFEMQGQSRAELTLEFKRRGVFEGYPIFNLNYNNRGIECEVKIGLHLTQFALMQAVEYRYTDIWKLLKQFSIKRTLRAEFKNAREREGSMFIYAMDKNECLYMYSLFEDWPVLCKFVQNERGIDAEVRCEDTELGNLSLIHI